MPTVLHRLARWSEADPQYTAQRFKRNGVWEEISAKEFMDSVFHLALYFESQGFTSKDVVCVLGYNSPEWVHCDLGAMLAGGRSAGIYPNSTPKDIRYILEHTEATILCVQNKEYFDKILAGGSSLPPTIKRIVIFDGDTSISSLADSYKHALTEGRKLAAGKPGKKLYDHLDRIQANEGAFMVYTSGTTGNPKGAILTHDNLTFTSDIVARYWRLPSGEGTLFSFLPLCHIAEKLQNVGVGISQRYTVSFCTKFENLSVELGEVQPTLLLSVPRLWEKMMEGVLNKLKRSTGTKKKLALWALDVGARVADARYSKRLPNPLDLIQLKIAERLVLSKIRQAMGLGKVQVLASGAAALAPHISKWFRCLQLEILEDFGQTESTGVICMTEPGVESAGTVGRTVPGVEMRIAEDGEVLTRGRHVFKGYHKDDAATAATIVDGWLHTGDLGEITERGLVRIRGRKKEILKTSGGKMIAPLPIEETLKACEFISQVCLVGDGRKYLSALITLDENTLNELKDRPGVLDELAITDHEIVGKVKAELDALNKKLASYEQIKKFTVLSREFSIADGEMTPTLKMKRNVIEARFRGLIDAMYGGAGAE